MTLLKDAASRFLKLKTIAVAGVSTAKKNPANYIFDKLKATGYQVYGLNPKGGEINGDLLYTGIGLIPEKVDGVVIGTPAAAALDVVKDCARHGVRHVWIHRSLDNGSYSAEAEKFCRENGINLIPSGCPMMFCQPVDFAHKCIKWVLGVTGKLPKEI